MATDKPDSHKPDKPSGEVKGNDSGVTQPLAMVNVKKSPSSFDTHMHDAQPKEWPWASPTTSPVIPNKPLETDVGSPKKSPPAEKPSAPTEKPSGSAHEKQLLEKPVPVPAKPAPKTGPEARDSTYFRNLG